MAGCTWSGHESGQTYRQTDSLTVRQVQKGLIGTISIYISIYVCMYVQGCMAYATYAVSRSLLS